MARWTLIRAGRATPAPFGDSLARCGGIRLSQHLPPEMTEILLPAFKPCQHFSGQCAAMKWAPDIGHAPRGFCGATGSIQEVELVLVVAEPGDPHEGAVISGATEEALLLDSHNQTLRTLDRSTDVFHKNIRYILEQCWPDKSPQDRLRKVWITESVLCSARTEGGSVPRDAERACAETYLRKQIDLFPSATIVAMGKKAQRRMAGLGCTYMSVAAAAPPYGVRQAARDSWRPIFALFRP